LTRRLVDVSHDAIVTQHDCGTTDGIEIFTDLENSKVVKTLGEVAYSRVLASDLKDKNGKIVIKKGTLITRDLIDIINASSASSLFVRSVITCEAEYGVCAKCYGKNLTSEDYINIGDPVGIIASQSIGEPGTQLTMRTFHVGGVAVKQMEKPFVKTNIDGEIKFLESKIVQNPKGESYVVSNASSFIVTNADGEVFTHKMPYGSKILVKEGSIKAGTVVYELDIYNILIISEYDGVCDYNDIYRDHSYKEDSNDTGISTKVIIKSNLHPRIMLKDDSGDYVKSINNNAVKYFLPISSVILVDNNQKINVGDIIAKVPKAEQKSKDITGGLPRVVDLFEARRPTKPSVLNEYNGRVVDIKHYRTKKKITIQPDDSDEQIEYVTSKDAHILVQDAAIVKKGEIIADGDSDPHEILRILGLKDLMRYMVDEIQSVYKLQGVKIDNRHIEIIIRQMSQKVVVTDPGDSELSVGKKVFYREIKKIVDKTKQKGGNEPKYTRLLQGITESSLQKESFISSASFQETSSVLMKASIRGDVDQLIGIKENVIIGNLIPVGTGFISSKLAKLVNAKSSS